MKKLLVFLLAAILVGAVGVYVVGVRPLVAPAAQTIAAEAALATPDLILIGAVNVRQAVFLERWFLGAPVVAASHARPASAPGDRSLLDHLAAARIDPRRDVDHVLFGLYPATDQGLRRAVVIVGQFDAPAVERYLAGELRGAPGAAGGRTSYEVRRVDPSRCEHRFRGLGAKPVPPSGRLRVVVDAADAARIRQKIEGWERGLRESRARWAQAAPSLGALFDSLSVTASGSRQTVEFTVDRKLASNLEAAVNELLAALFAGLAGERGATPGRTADAAPRAEKIDSDPT